MGNFYEVLGLKKDATAKEITRKYRALAMKFHPDRNNGGKTSEERFKAINAAYETLNDPEKRRAYDASINEPANIPQPPVSHNFQFTGR